MPPTPAGLARLTAALRSREGAGALLLLVCAGITGLEAAGLSMGQGRMVGPGYFPAILSGLFTLFALILLVQACLPGRAGLDWGPLRPPLMMVAAIAAFALLFPRIGAAGAIVVLVVIAALAERGRRPLELAVLGLALLGLVWLVFRLGLGLQLPMLPGARG